MHLVAQLGSSINRMFGTAVKCLPQKLQVIVSNTPCTEGAITAIPNTSNLIYEAFRLANKSDICINYDCSYLEPPLN